ncbi:MAG: TIGR04282 family arsenosugar biosynthesis glycosyltransferase [Bacteroidota bacterium]
MKSSTDLLLIFTRNPELGKCKTRLATKVGDLAALDIYNFLLEHTVSITQHLTMDRNVYYSEEIWENDIWQNNVYGKKIQNGTDLGQRMMNAFVDGFKNGYQKIVVIGSDMYDLSKVDLEGAFSKLDTHDFVLGPAEDGGYYLLGMKELNVAVFQNKDWGTPSVLKATLNDLTDEKYALLPLRNDVDHYEDIQHLEAFQPFLKHIKDD